MTKIRMFNFTPPIWENVANDGIGCSHKSCNVSGGAHFCARRLFLFLIILILAGAFVSGFRAGRRAAHAGQVWVKNISDGAPSDYNFGIAPSDPDYTQMKVKK